MTNVDQFESVFRSAAKPVLHYERVEFGRILVVTDLDDAGARAFMERAQAFISRLRAADTWSWEYLTGDAFASSGELLDKVKAAEPTLVVSYRNLHSDGWRWPHSLGEYTDLLTQIAPAPVLVTPHPKAGYAAEHALDNTERVMAVTDHLAGDDRLVNYASRLTQRDGTLFLAHVEDEAAFERFIDVIGKIPSIDTDAARVSIRNQLLKEPADYITSCRDVLAREGIPIDVEKIVTLGHQLSDYKRIVEEHQISLLILNTRDEDQLAMHGVAYPLAIELRNIPLLML